MRLKIYINIPMENIIEKYNVSRETLRDLKAYEASLREWQNKFNLVSKASLEDAWNRHFIDSLQLLPLIPDNVENIYDFGSGAGFPGLVLAVALKKKTPYLNIKLAESIKKKTLYLNYVAEMLKLENVQVVNDRIENIKTEKVDVITSRAMCNLNDLLGYAVRFCGKKTKCIFLKGKKYAEELSEAQKRWSFKYELIKSVSCEEGMIIVITDLSEKRR